MKTSCLLKLGVYAQAIKTLRYTDVLCVVLHWEQTKQEPYFALGITRFS